MDAKIDGVAGSEGGKQVVEFIGCVTEDGEETFDYLAIGNSIMRHGLADYWWGEWGMAASEPEYDYYHRVVTALEEKKGSANAAAYNYYVWESQSHDRAETWDLLDNYLAPGIDLITVQLSENCSDMSTFKSDFRALLLHLEERCGEDCQIIVVDDFWDEGKGRIKKNVCNELNIPFVNLDDIRGAENYMVGMNTVVYGDDGAEHIIEHEGVARHPNNEGMRVIAERVLALIGQQP